MHIILGIHSPNSDLKEIAEFILKSMKSEPQTYFLNFEYAYSGEPLDIKKLKAQMGKMQSHIIDIPARKGSQSSMVAYAPKFVKVLLTLKSKLGEKEKVLATSIGGSAKHCFEEVNGTLHKNETVSVQRILKKVFGRRLLTPSSYLPLIYGSKYTEFLWQQKRAKQNAQRQRKKTTKPKRK
jgi:hypothetical protein